MSAFTYWKPPLLFNSGQCVTTPASTILQGSLLGKPYVTNNIEMFFSYAREKDEGIAFVFFSLHVCRQNSEIPKT